MSLSRTIDVDIKGNKYSINYPTVGQQMDMDILKLQMTSDKYDVMKFSFNPSFQRRALEADAVSTVNILIPGLRKDLTVKSMFDLSREEMDIVIKTYEEDILPWLEEWNTLLSKINDDKKES
jgi:hypothetical protein